MAIAGKESCPLREGADTRRALQPTGRAGRDGCPSLLPDFVARGSNYQIANQITLQCKQRSAPGDVKGTWRGVEGGEVGRAGWQPAHLLTIHCAKPAPPQSGSEEKHEPAATTSNGCFFFFFWFGGF